MQPDKIRASGHQKYETVEGSRRTCCQLCIGARISVGAANYFIFFKSSDSVFSSSDLCVEEGKGKPHLQLSGITAT